MKVRSADRWHWSLGALHGLRLLLLGSLLTMFVTATNNPIVVAVGAVTSAPAIWAVARTYRRWVSSPEQRERAQLWRQIQRACGRYAHNQVLTIDAEGDEVTLVVLRDEVRGIERWRSSELVPPTGDTAGYQTGDIYALGLKPGQIVHTRLGWPVTLDADGHLTHGCTASPYTETRSQLDITAAARLAEQAGMLEPSLDDVRELAQQISRATRQAAGSHGDN